jgi:hypothetical protein
MKRRLDGTHCLFTLPSKPGLSSGHLALLVGREERDVGRIAAASYADDAFDRASLVGSTSHQPFAM